MTFHTKTTFHVLAARSHAWKSVESSFQRRSQFCLTSGALQMSFGSSEANTCGRGLNHHFSKFHVVDE